MKKLILTVAMLAAFGISGNAAALTPEEETTLARVSQEFLGAIPEDGYHVLAEDVLARIKGGKQDFVLVDVRMPKAKKFDQGHLPGAMYIGLRELAKPENLALLPRDKDIILYCDTGHEQNKALGVLRMLGYKAFDMKWGYSSWKVTVPTGKTLQALEGSILNDYPVEK